MSDSIIDRQALIDAFECLDLIDRQAATKSLVRPRVIDPYDQYWTGRNDQYDADVFALKDLPSAETDLSDYSDRLWKNAYERGKAEGARMPSAEPEIIRCKDCKHWTQSTGKMKGYGLGRCDFHDADLVTCNGFCYWAEGRTDG